MALNWLRKPKRESTIQEDSPGHQIFQLKGEIERLEFEVEAFREAARKADVEIKLLRGEVGRLRRQREEMRGHVHELFGLLFGFKESKKPKAPPEQLYRPLSRGDEILVEFGAILGPPDSPSRDMSQPFGLGRPDPRDKLGLVSVEL